MANHELEIERLNRLYSALSQISQAIVRKRSRPELFHRVCEALIDPGGFGMAWIGWNDPSTHRLMPVSQVGDQNGYLQSIAIYTDERAEGRGPSGTAFREDRPYICNDLLEDPAALPWRAEQTRRGFRASAVFPIHERGRAVGTLSVYSERRGFFRDKEIALLGEAAADLSCALDRLLDEEASRSAEEVVKRFVAIVESTDDAIISTSLDGAITSWNRAAETMFGYQAAEVLGSSIEQLVPAAGADEQRWIQRTVERGESVKGLETVRARKNGTLLPVSITVSPIWGTDANTGATTIVGSSRIVRDITERKKAEALAQSEQGFARDLVEAMPSIFYLYNAEGRFLRWNRNFETVSGYAADEIARMHPLDFFPVAERALVQARIGEVFEHGEASTEASFITKDGKALPYFFTGRRIALDGASCLVGVGVDISEQKRAEDAVRRSEERYRTTLETILEGCQLLSFEWRYLYLNPAAALQNRRPNSELLGRTMMESWPGIEQSEVFQLLHRCMEERTAAHAEVPFGFADGSMGWFDVRAQAVPEGLFVLSIDITERKQAERALRELNENLERKVAARTVDLDSARERAESADRIKSAFLATMSHELRTPLNSILGFTGIVLKGMAGPVNPEQFKQLGMVQASARHLLDLINDVLDISKIEAGQLEVRCAPFDVRASIERVVASTAPLAEKKGLAMRMVLPDVLPPMESDRRRVEQILLNLLNNALKFTDQGTVTLTAETIERPDAVVAGAPGMTKTALRIRVADTGIGMKQEDLSILFQPFRQLDSGLQRQHEGTGLGLAICRRLTELLGGTIHAESVWGHGSVFVVVLPMTRKVTL